MSNLPRLNGARCRCSGCGEHFHSVGAFDKHRTGTYQPLARRCLSTDEMRDTGMVQRADGFWTTGKSGSYSPRVSDSSHDRAEAA